MTSQTTSRHSRILWQWSATLCSSDLLRASDPRRQAVSAVRWEDAGDAHDEQARAWLAVDWAVRTLAPAWLDAAGLTDDAEGLRALPLVASVDTVRATVDALGLVVSAAVRAARSGREGAMARAGGSRAETIKVEFADEIGTQVIGRLSCGHLVELAARENIPDRAGTELTLEALRAAQGAAQALVWQAMERGEDPQAECQRVADALLTSAVDLYVAMGAEHGEE